MGKNPKSTSLFADLLLLFVTLCWGVTFPLIEDAVRYVSPSVFVAVRFFIAALFLLPFAVKYKRLLLNPEVLWAGICLGFFNAICYFTQTIGMAYVTSAQGAFITGMSVVIVPFVLPIFSVGRPQLKDIVCSLICLLGLYVLIGGHLASLNVGALWILGCAFAVALSIVYLQKVSQHTASLELLVFYQILFTAVFVSPFTVGESFFHIYFSSVIVAILFCALIATSLALFLQAKYQRHTTASRAAMIYCFEPIFATIFGLFINGEAITASIFFGGFLILMGVLLSEYYSQLKRFIYCTILRKSSRLTDLRSD